MDTGLVVVCNEYGIGLGVIVYRSYALFGVGTLSGNWNWLLFDHLVLRRVWLLRERGAKQSKDKLNCRCPFFESSAKTHHNVQEGSSSWYVKVVRSWVLKRALVLLQRPQQRQNQRKNPNLKVVALDGVLFCKSHITSILSLSSLFRPFIIYHQSPICHHFNLYPRCCSLMVNIWLSRWTAQFAILDPRFIIIMCHPLHLCICVFPLLPYAHVTSPFTSSSQLISIQIRITSHAECCYCRFRLIHFIIINIFSFGYFWYSLVF